MYFDYDDYVILYESIQKTHPNSELEDGLRKAIAKANQYSVNDRVYTGNLGWGTVESDEGTYYKVKLDETHEHYYGSCQEITHKEIYKINLIQK